MKMTIYRPRRKARNEFSPHGLQKEPTLLDAFILTSSLLPWETANFPCAGLPGRGALSP